MNNEQKRFNELSERVIAWADRKGILEKATHRTQFSKFLEEYKETWDAVWVTKCWEEIVDGIGDTAVTIIIHHKLTLGGDPMDSLDAGSVFEIGGFDGNEQALATCLGQMSNCAYDPIVDCYEDALQSLNCLAKYNGLDLNDCLESALEVIEKRTGRMINGTFVKDVNNELLRD